MNNSIKNSLFCCLIAVLLSTVPAHAKTQGQDQQNMSTRTLSALVEEYRGKPYKDFDRFALDVYITGKRFLTKHQRDAIGEYAANQRLTVHQRFVVHRLLGVYTRLKYGGEARRMLAKLVSIPSYRQKGVEQHKNDDFISMEKTIASYAKKFGLKYKNVGGRVYEVTLPSSKRGALIGLHAHADVLPPNRDLWLLGDGTKLDPFKMTQVADRLYGRGTQHRKSDIVALMMAMRTIKEEKIKLFNKIRLLIDTTQESTADTMEYYLKRNPVPSYNISLGSLSPGGMAICELGNSDQRSPWLRSLLEIASENLDLAEVSCSTSGDVLGHPLPNEVQFALSQAGQKQADQNRNQFTSIDQFLISLQIATELIMRTGLIRNQE